MVTNTQNRTVSSAIPNTDLNGERNLATAIRALAMDAVEAAKSGHPGMPMGMADVATVLFREFLNFDPAAPHWPDRDRFVLSAGHGSMLLYALLYLTGYPGISIDTLKRFRQLGSPAAGHPEFSHLPGIETTTGPLGQGLANAVGMAIAEAGLRAEFGAELVDHRTYVIAGDGCLMEGIGQEAISLAGHLRLNKLVVFFDDNRISIDGPTDLTVSDDQLARFRASGWNVASVDGHNGRAVSAAIAATLSSDKPSLIACRTQIAFGAPTKAGSSASHGSPLGLKEVEGARQALNWPHAPFEIPQGALDEWRRAGDRGRALRVKWLDRLAGAAPAVRLEFERRVRGRLPDGFVHAISGVKQGFVRDKPTLATRVASQQVLDAIAPALPELLGGSADLTGSNLTKAKVFAPMKPGEFKGRYVHYGVREHAMAAAMNGIALHRGFIPYGGTFLVFSDYCRPSIRLSALMEQRVIYVMTHDSIGLGEDGPTHQPVEHLAALRTIPNLRVLRPADAVETAECWEAALQFEGGPTLLALSRQNLPALRTQQSGENLSVRGGYILDDADRKRDVTLIATGSEVAIAMKARRLLDAEGISAIVVSMPCLTLFEQQPGSYRTEVLGRNNSPRVVIEAGIRQGWDFVLGSNGLFVGMRGFGASGPADELYRHFGITAEAVAASAKTLL